MLYLAFIPVNNESAPMHVVDMNRNTGVIEGRHFGSPVCVLQHSSELRYCVGIRDVAGRALITPLGVAIKSPQGNYLRVATVTAMEVHNWIKNRRSHPASFSKTLHHLLLRDMVVLIPAPSVLPVWKLVYTPGLNTKRYILFILIKVPEHWQLDLLQHRYVLVFRQVDHRGNTQIPPRLRTRQARPTIMNSEQGELAYQP